MIDFLIKSTASLAILLACYHLLLEKEKMHQFNRFFLLFGLVFSFSIPFFTIEVIEEVTTKSLPQNGFQLMENTTAIVQESTNYWMVLLYIVYGLVTLVLLIRFITNGLQLYRRSKSNRTIDYNNAKLVLLPNPTLPYTFLNTIFINQKDYENRTIENELYTHELIHVTQKHTLDILVMETLKVVFWFNPILYFYKKAIQLNHEFLADEEVVQSHNNVPFYQNLLISKANANPTYYLASNLNYSVTKKRLIMMTKTTSQSTNLLKKAALVPLFAALTFFTCVKTIAQVNPKKTPKETPQKGTNLNEVWKNAVFYFRDSNGKIIAEKKYLELTEKERNSIPPPPPPTIKPIKQNDAKSKILKIEMTSDGPKMSTKKSSTKSNTQYNVPPPPPPTVERKTKQNDVLNSTDINDKPNYPGGMGAFYKFVGINYYISDEMAANKIKGKVYLKFIVEKDGSLNDFTVVRDIGYGTGEEAIRVLKLSPKWIPGKINDEPVRTMYSLPINIETAG